MADLLVAPVDVPPIATLTQLTVFLDMTPRSTCASICCRTTLSGGYMFLATFTSSGGSAAYRSQLIDVIPDHSVSPFESLSLRSRS